MLIKCEVPESLSGVVSSAGPIDCAPSGLRRTQREWKHSLGGLAVLIVAMLLLVLLADEAMGGRSLEALLHMFGRV